MTATRFYAVPRAKRKSYAGHDKVNFAEGLEKAHFRVACMFEDADDQM